MRKQIALILAAVLLAVAAMATPALAGGWATFTIDKLPRNVHAGEPFTLGFVARAHGHTPFTIANGAARFVFHNPATGEIVTAPAAAAGEVGYHAAKIVLPTAGSWTWELQPDWYPPVKYEPLEVLAAAAAPPPVPWPAWGVIGGGLALVVIAFFITPRGGKRRLLGLGVGAAGVLLLVAGGLWSSPPAVTAQVNRGSDLQAYGKALFAAKGCVTCHRHDEMAGNMSVEMGPNLTHYRNSPEYLRTWLKDPSSVRDTKMPTLGLAEGEIEALVAFINHD